MRTDQQIAALQAEIDRLKACSPPHDPTAVSEWRDRMREIAERRASQGAMSHYTRDQLRAMREAAPDDQVKAIAMRDNRAPTSPSQAGSSGKVNTTHSNVGLPGSNTSGWRDARPLGPQPGINHVDRQLDEQDRRDRLELIQAEEARRRAEQRQR
jgi:hypothetical protein